METDDILTMDVDDQDTDPLQFLPVIEETTTTAESDPPSPGKSGTENGADAEPETTKNESDEETEVEKNTSGDSRDFEPEIEKKRKIVKKKRRKCTNATEKIGRYQNSDSKIGDDNIDSVIASSKYKDHIRRIGDSLVCGFCDREYPRLNPLRRHLLLHLSAKDPNSFQNTRLSMKEREEVKSYALETDWGFQCKVCEMSYTLWGSIRAHIMRRHFRKNPDELAPPKKSEQKKLVAQFESVRSSKYDEYVKRNEKGYLCAFCNREYPRIEPLRYHLVRHFQSADPAGFHTRRRSMREREEINRFAEKTGTGHKCTECGSEYTLWNSLRTHIIRHHIKVELDKITINPSKDNKEQEQEMRLFPPAKFIKEENGQYCCLICSATNELQHDILTHLRKNHLQRGRATEEEVRTYSVEGEDGYHCMICMGIFHDSTVLQYHVKWHFPSAESKRGIKVRCDICCSIVSKEKLDRHMIAKHADSLPDELCPVCGVTVQARDMRSHMRRHEIMQGTGTEYSSGPRNQELIQTMNCPEKPIKRRDRRREYVCEECHESFKIKRLLLKHIKTHRLREFIRCPSCPRKVLEYNLEAHLAKHEREKQGLDMRICEHCGKTYHGGVNLSRHIYQCHTGKRAPDRRSERRSEKKPSKKLSLPCPQCHKVFTTNVSLKDHLNCHKGIKPYLCEVCARGFPRRSSLRAHRRTHINPRPYQCRFCSKEFRFRGVWVRHERTHTDNHVYRCEDCERDFVLLEDFDEHKCRPKPRRDKDQKTQTEVQGSSQPEARSQSVAPAQNRTIPTGCAENCDVTSGDVMTDDVATIDVTTSDVSSAYVPNGNVQQGFIHNVFDPLHRPPPPGLTYWPPGVYAGTYDGQYPYLFPTFMPQFMPSCLGHSTVPAAQIETVAEASAQANVGLTPEQAHIGRGLHQAHLSPERDQDVVGSRPPPAHSTRGPRQAVLSAETRHVHSPGPSRTDLSHDVSYHVLPSADHDASDVDDDGDDDDDDDYGSDGDDVDSDDSLPCAPRKPAGKPPLPPRQISTGIDAFAEFLRKRACGEVSSGPVNTGIRITRARSGANGAKK